MGSHGGVIHRTMPFPSPEDCGDPVSFVDALLAEYGPEISEEKFVLMFKEGAAWAKSQGQDPISELQAQMVEMGESAGIESAKVTDVSNDAIAKVQDIIIPFVAAEIFKWLDRDSSKGVSKDEIMFFASMAMEGEEKAMEVCKSFLWSVLDKNGDGKEVKETLEKMQGYLEGLAASDEDDIPVPLKLMLDDVKSCKAFAKEQASGGADLAKVVAFNRTLLDGRIAVAKKMLDDDETFEELPIPPAILAKIREFGEPVMGAMSKIMDDKLETMTKCIFDICDANKDGQLDEDEFLGIAGLMDHERSVDDKFNAFLALIDTDGDKKVSPDELKEFAGKVFDAGVCGTQVGIDLYASIAKTVAALAIAFLLEKMVGGDELSKEKADQMIGQVMEDGPECLLGPLMEE